ncbi:ribosomal-processing cysteine protease Prp [Thermoflavimicrobium dichotomicum]|uniref:Ribosomal processing cysteine protease Prp n=1 Tax=Thermoflavimicrobium dichotomicum TaxID=46223 RepID=A0A1I3R6G8_9BACL|nr:ribosomal-processing cysteine protease Prp [Thermoflavimicrobium dichotomicum]SFJ41715.1 hypothetical protein SAMN05421852_10937 [Thermoflavimicrobium dichotomicum]
MIKILVERDKNGQVKRVLIKGHAYYDEPGKDIVCAAVSGITHGMVNAVEKLTGIQIHEDDVRPGKLDCQIPGHVTDVETLSRIHLLLEAMVMSLEDVADEAPDFVKIIEKRI